MSLAFGISSINLGNMTSHSHSEGYPLPFANASSTEKKAQSQKKHCNKISLFKESSQVLYYISKLRGFLYKNFREMGYIVFQI